MNILILDNYDSFTYNIAHYVGEILSKAPDIKKNDEVSLEELSFYDAILLSPGPGVPSDAGILKEVIAEYAGKIPILGICLGLQAIVEVYGGKIINLDQVFHGVATAITVLDEKSVLFHSIPKKIRVGRYHSWAASIEHLPDILEVTCVDDSGNIMGIRHKNLPIEAVQFHPESILTPDGKKMIKNFIEWSKEYHRST